jgi:type IV secretory pathway VirB2 component (pilin)
MILPLKSMAASSVPVGTTNLPQSAVGMPPELLQLLLQILKISVGTAVLLSMILLVGAGIMRMFRKKKEATEWTTDIVKGLIQILVAVPIVFLIYFVVNLLFSNNGWFVSPF